MSVSNKKQRKIKAFTGISSILVVLAILTLLNLIAVRHNVTKDTTGDGRFTLAEQTVKILESLDEPIKIFSFFRETDADYEIVRDLLQQYDVATENIGFQFVDADKNPIIAKQFDVSTYQTLVLTLGDDFRKVSDPSEHALTNTILSLLQGGQKKRIYFTRGNGELDPESFENDGLGLFVTALKDTNYAPETINLMAVKSIPEDCDVLIIAGPVTDPVPEVKLMILEYLQSGGRLFIALEPGSGQFWNTVLQTTGVKVLESVVLDPSGFQNIFQPIIEDWKSHPVTDGFEYGLVLHVATSVTADSSPDTEWQVTELGLTTDKTWLEFDLESIENNEPVFDENKHVKGAFPVAVASERRMETDQSISQSSKVFVIGDADFAGNIFYQTFAAHEPFLMNIVHWLADEKELIALPPRKTISQPLLLKPGQTLMGFLVPVVILPLFIALIGAVRIVVRRRQA